MENNLQLISEATLAVAMQLESAPIAVGTLQIAYDYTYNREVLFALCYNGSAKTVRSIYFNLICMDDAGDTLGELTGECLRGLSAAPGETFGEASPVVLPFRGCARVNLDLQKVVFTDDTVWRIGDAPIEMLPHVSAITSVSEASASEALASEGPAPKTNAPVAEVSETEAPSADAPETDTATAEAPADSPAPASIPAEWLNPPATVEGYRSAAAGLSTLNDPTKSYLIKKFTALADKLEAEAAEAARKAAEAELTAKQDAEYKRLAALAPESAEAYDALAADWKALGNYKDAAKRSAEAAKKAKSLRTSEKRQAQKRAEEERIAAELAAIKRKKRIKASIWIGSVVTVILAVTLFITLVAIPAARFAKYESTTDLVNEGRYTEALAILEELGDYEDCKQRIKELKVALTGREDALFFSSEEYPQYSIENGVLSFDSTTFKYVGTELIIPDFFNDQRVTAISGAAFSKATNLETVKLAPTVTTVGKNAFSECVKLTSFEAPGLVTLGEEAFRGCTALKKVALAESLTAIGEKAFQGCTSLAEIDLPENLRRLPDSLFLGCTALKKLSFSSRLSVIGNETFGYCTALPSLTLPETLESIGNNAFLGCQSFTTLSIPDSVTYMGDKAMANCTALTQVKLSANLTKIAARTFSGCKALTTVNLPAGLTQIGYAAFENCSALSKVTYSGTESDFAKIEILAENGLLTTDKITFGK